MRAARLISWAVATGLVPVTVAQLSGWESNEVNATICMWQQLRAAVVRDTLYMDGGYLWWTPGLSDGSYGSTILDENTVGVVYTLNFSLPFKMSDNITALFGERSKVGDAAANTDAPTYYDGAMLANDDEFFLYGGLFTPSDSISSEPDADEITKWQGYQYGIEKPAFSVGFESVTMSNLTRYIAYGGTASVPSENLAFYFSGMRAPDWGGTDYPTGNESLTASVVADTLITLDMAIQLKETWSNDTIPDSIPGRANPELVWVPVGEKGILVALGGVLYPEFITGFHASDNQSASEDESPAFMTSINIYDIANSAWYTQNTTGGPGALTRGCAVMQPAEDYSSFNIYWYGGYDGLHATDESYFKDDVWVLSLPSFTWTKVASGRSGWGRAGHKCVMPYPDQMMVVGGYPAQPGTGSTCLTDIIMLFNVSSLEWLDSYDPTVYSDYSVPSSVYSAIGGNAKGSATSTAPSSWATSALEDVFKTSYNTSKITTYYPYPVDSTTPAISTYTPSATGNSSSSVPKFLAPLLGVILGLVLITSIIVGFLLWRRRKLMRKNGGVSVVATDENGNRIVNWLNGQRFEKATTATDTTEAPVLPTSPEPEMAGLRHPHSTYQRQFTFPERSDEPHHQVPYEMEDTMLVAELPDNSRIPELSETSMSASDIVDRHSRFGTTSPMETSRPMFSPFTVNDHASMVSSNSAAGASNSARGGVPPAPPSSASHQSSSVAAGAGAGAGAATIGAASSRTRPDSSALPQPSPSNRYGAAAAELPSSGISHQQPQDPSPRGESGVSAFSERERTHLRNLSDPATVSTMDGGSSPPMHAQGRFSPTPTTRRPIMEEGTLSSLVDERGGGQSTSSVIVVSPPTAGEADGEDYLSAKGGSGSSEEEMVVSPVVQSRQTAAASNDGPRPDSGRRSAFQESAEDI